MAEANAGGLVAADGVELALFETHCDVGEGLAGGCWLKVCNGEVGGLGECQKRVALGFG